MRVAHCLIGKFFASINTFLPPHSLILSYSPQHASSPRISSPSALSPLPSSHLILHLHLPIFIFPSSSSHLIFPLHLIFALPTRLSSSHFQLSTHLPSLPSLPTSHFPLPTSHFPLPSSLFPLPSSHASLFLLPFQPSPHFTPHHRFVFTSSLLPSYTFDLTFIFTPTHACFPLIRAR